MPILSHALLEASCAAAEAAGVRRLTAEVSDHDAAILTTLRSAQFARLREACAFRRAPWP